MLPSVARVRLDVARDHVVVEEDVSLPRGAYAGGALDLFVAFAAPGPPLAFDAHLLAVPDGVLEAAHEAEGTALSSTRAPHRPRAAYPLLGPETMAGVVVQIDEATLTRALAAGGMAALRLRFVVPLPDVGPGGAREVLVRLGATDQTPLTLGHLQIASPDVALQRVEARLCGPDADDHALSIAPVSTASSGRTAARSPLGGKPKLAPAPLAPVLAPRHPSDDLCVRFWTETPSP